MASFERITLADAEALIALHDQNRQRELAAIHADHAHAYAAAQERLEGQQRKLEQCNQLLQQEQRKLNQYDQTLQEEQHRLELCNNLLHQEQTKTKALEQVINEFDQTHDLLMREMTVLKNPTQRFLRVRRSPQSPAPDQSGFKCSLMRLTFQDSEEYSFDRIFDSAAEKHDNADIYGRLLIQLGRVREGNHVVIIAYGPSGAGKTSTLYDGTPMGGGTRDPSILARIVQDQLKGREAGWALSITWIEAHHSITRGQDTLYNLLQTPKQKVTHRVHTSQSSVPPSNCFMYSAHKDYFVDAARNYLHPVPITSFDAYQAMHARATKNRATEKTGLNNQSSRASTFLELRLEYNGQLQGVITLVDTMGQESADKTTQKQRVAAGAGMATNSELSKMLAALGQQNTAKGKQGTRVAKGLTDSVKQPLNKLLLPAFCCAVLEAKHHCHVTIIGHVFDKSDIRHTRDTLETLKQWETHAMRVEHNSAVQCITCALTEKEGSLNRPIDDDVGFDEDGNECQLTYDENKVDMHEGTLQDMDDDDECVHEVDCNTKVGYEGDRTMTDVV